MIYEIHPRKTNGTPLVYNEFLVKDFAVHFMESNWHEDPEILFITKGEGHVIIDAERIEVSKNDIIIANSECMHTIGSDTALEYQCFIIDRNFFEENAISFEDFYIQPLIKSDYLAEKLYELIDVSQSDCLYKIPKQRSILLDIIICLCENFKETNSSSIKSTKKIKKAITYINANFIEKITIDDISEFSGYSKTHLSREFKYYTNLTIIEYINQIRCRKAKKLLSTGKYNVTEVTTMCGFESPSYFTKIYKKIIGNLPFADIPKQK